MGRVSQSWPASRFSACSFCLWRASLSACSLSCSCTRKGCTNSSCLAGICLHQILYIQTSKCPQAMGGSSSALDGAQQVSPHLRGVGASGRAEKQQQRSNPGTCWMASSTHCHILVTFHTQVPACTGTPATPCAPHSLCASESGGFTLQGGGNRPPKSAARLMRKAHLEDVTQLLVLLLLRVGAGTKLLAQVGRRARRPAMDCLLQACACLCVGGVRVMYECVGARACQPSQCAVANTTVITHSALQGNSIHARLQTPLSSLAQPYKVIVFTFT